MKKKEIKGKKKKRKKKKLEVDVNSLPYMSHLYTAQLSEANMMASKCFFHH